MFSKDGMASLPRYVHVHASCTQFVCHSRCTCGVTPHSCSLVPRLFPARSRVECIHLYLHRKKRATSNKVHLECALFRVPRAHQRLQLTANMNLSGMHLTTHKCDMSVVSENICKYPRLNVFSPFHAHTHACMHTHARTHVHMHTHTYTHTHTHTHKALAQKLH